MTIGAGVSGSLLFLAIVTGVGIAWLRRKGML